LTFIFVHSLVVCYRYLFMRENHHGIYDVELDIRTCIPTPLINIKYHFSTHSKQITFSAQRNVCMLDIHFYPKLELLVFINI